MHGSMKLVRRRHAVVLEIVDLKNYNALVGLSMGGAAGLANKSTGEAGNVQQRGSEHARVIQTTQTTYLSLISLL